MLARRLEAFAVAVGSLPSAVVFVALLVAAIGLLASGRLEPGWPRALVIAAADAIAFGWVWCVGALSDRAQRGSLGRGALTWAVIAVAAVLLRGWIELADPVNVRSRDELPALVASIAGVVAILLSNFGLPVWAAVRLGAVRPEPWRWIECAGGAALLVFSPIGVWYVQPWLRELLRDPPSVRR